MGIWVVGHAILQSANGSRSKRIVGHLGILSNEVESLVGKTCIERVLWYNNDEGSGTAL